MSNKGLLGWPVGEFMPDGLRGWPLDERVDDVAQAALLTPPVTDYLAWYDASDSDSVVVSSGAVAIWHDKGPNKFDLWNGVTTDRPAYGSRYINQKLVVDFDGSNDNLKTQDFNIPNKPVSIAMVLDVDTVGNRAPCGSRVASNGRTYYRVQTATAGLCQMRAALAQIQSNLSLPDVGRAYFCCVSANTSDVRFIVNQAQSVTADASAGVLGDGFQMGAYAGIEFYDGAIGELMIWDRELDVREMYALFDYCRRKWGIC